MRWYRHITSHSRFDNKTLRLAKMILQGTVQRGGGGGGEREKERQSEKKKRWKDNIPEWTGLGLGEALRKAEDREEWRKVVARSSLMPPTFIQTTG